MRPFASFRSREKKAPPGRANLKDRKKRPRPAGPQMMQSFFRITNSCGKYNSQNLQNSRLQVVILNTKELEPIRQGSCFRFCIMSPPMQPYFPAQGAIVFFSGERYTFSRLPPYTASRNTPSAPSAPQTGPPRRPFRSGERISRRTAPVRPPPGGGSPPPGSSHPGAE